MNTSIFSKKELVVACAVMGLLAFGGIVSSSHHKQEDKIATLTERNALLRDGMEKMGNYNKAMSKIAYETADSLYQNEKALAQCKKMSQRTSDSGVTGK